MKQKKMAYDINEMPPMKEAIVLAFQHLFAMFGATILVPILVNSGAGEEVLTIPVALVSSGIGTLIYILCTKGKVPIYLGSSFAYITYIVAAFKMTQTVTYPGDFGAALTGIVVVGLIYIVVSVVIKFAGVEWLKKLLPPVVIGPMIMIIGLSLAPNAISQMGLAAETLDYKVVLVALISFIVTSTFSNIAVTRSTPIPVSTFFLGNSVTTPLLSL